MSSADSNYVYALKCIFNAHAADVRVVTSTSIPCGGILTGSRDNTAKVWSPVGKSFKEYNVFTGATTFIASVCVLPASSQYPNGLLLAGSNDCSIYGFTPDSSEPVLRLLGHSGPVCSLSYGKHGYLVSGSWDKTARVWSGQQCVATLQGHLEAVWATAVFPAQDGMLTGSADRTIRLWRGKVCEKVFTGHEDCVRGLATICDKKFLSCSNDCTVRLWMTTGDCLKIFSCHSDYIYSITLLDNGTDFATCGEDQNVKIWKNGICVQSVVVASKSLWSIACLSNGDLAVGSSEGKVYVLEKVPVDHFDRMSEQGKVIDEKMEESDVSEPFDIRSSIYNGETVAVVDHENRNMYLCQYSHEKGSKVTKEPLDLNFLEDTFYKKPAEEQVKDPSKKDYEFDVDVENVFYKLSFNKGDNPWEVAMKFVADHNLPFDHVSQIVNFILENTTMSFTNELYPAQSYITYCNINVVGLRAKLLEFSEKVGKEESISASEVDELVLLAHLPDIVSVDQLSSLDKAISWSDEFLFPVLDLLRLGVKSKGLREKISSYEFVNRLLMILRTTKRTVNMVLIEKIFCNMFGIEGAEALLSMHQEKILECVKDKILTSDKSIQKAGSALFLNFAIASYRGIAIKVDKFCSTLVQVLRHLKDVDAVYRMLIAVGTVCTRSTVAVANFKSENITDYILSVEMPTANESFEKVVDSLCSDFE